MHSLNSGLDNGDSRQERELQTVAESPLQTPSSAPGGSTPAERFLQAELELCARLRLLSFGEPVRYIYNPLEYAWETHRCYAERYCHSGQNILFLGMNPGPFGMAQTGVREAHAHQYCTPTCIHSFNCLCLENHRQTQ